MKRLAKILLLAAVCGLSAAAGDAEWHSLLDMPVYGRGEGISELVRLPDSLQQATREPVWDLSRDCAGLAIAFSTNSPSIEVRWVNRKNFAMSHMTDIGVRGVDLYAKEADGKWGFAGAAKVVSAPDNRHVWKLISNMAPEMRDYIMYLPLYDGISDIEIGVAPGSKVGQPREAIFADEAPIIYYGTSITQGGCASRPGMAHTNILARRMGREFINLGFSGNGRLDPEIGDYIASMDASLYVLDCLPNCTSQQLLDLFQPFYAKIRAAHPDAPILVIENPVFPTCKFDTDFAATIDEKNRTIRELVGAIQASGDSRITLVSASAGLGDDGEYTVDGVHYTDLGFLRFADYLQPIITNLLEQ